MRVVKNRTAPTAKGRFGTGYGGGLATLEASLASLRSSGFFEQVRGGGGSCLAWGRLCPWSCEGWRVYQSGSWSHGG